jgi:ADP-ribosylglycohydrolase
MLSTADSVAGSLLGLALGDALGFAVEGAPRIEAVAYADDLIRRGEAAVRAHGSFRFGQYSDDTQLARELLASVVDGGGCWRAERFATRLGELFQRGADVGAGPGTRTAALRIAAGESWVSAGTPSPYAGNGSAMRVGPLGALYVSRMELVSRLAVQQSLVTHRDPRCAAGAVAIAGATALAATHRNLDGREVLETLALWTEPLEPMMARGLTALVDWIGLAPELAASRIHGLGLAVGTRSFTDGFTPFVSTTVLWSLYAFLRSPDDYLDAVTTAIAGGGDTDTTAAMTGAMVGARLGHAALPAALLAKLEDRNAWRAPELEALARSAARLVGSERRADAGH